MRVLLPEALIRLFPGCPAEQNIEAETVAGLIEALDRRHPGMADRLRDSSPALRRHINVFVAGERATLATALKPGSEIAILTAISGG